MTVMKEGGGGNGGRAGLWGEREREILNAGRARVQVALSMRRVYLMYRPKEGLLSMF